MSRTAYEVLGLKEDATLKEIKARYHELMQKHHTDKVENNAEEQQTAKEMAQKYVAAYEWLTKKFQRHAEEGCDIFFMSSTGSSQYKNSDLTHLYLYKDQQDQIFYQIEGKKVFLADKENQENQDLCKDIKEMVTFDQLENNPIECGVINIIDQILAITSARNHTNERELPPFDEPLTDKEKEAEEVKKQLAELTRKFQTDIRKLAEEFSLEVTNTKHLDELDAIRASTLSRVNADNNMPNTVEERQKYYEDAVNKFREELMNFIQEKKAEQAKKEGNEKQNETENAQNPNQEGSAQNHEQSSQSNPNTEKGEPENSTNTQPGANDESNKEYKKSAYTGWDENGKAADFYNVVANNTALRDEFCKNNNYKVASNHPEKKQLTFESTNDKNCTITVTDKKIVTNSEKGDTSALDNMIELYLKGIANNPKITRHSATSQDEEDKKYIEKTLAKKLLENGADYSHIINGKTVEEILSPKKDNNQRNESGLGPDVPQPEDNQQYRPRGP